MMTPPRVFRSIFLAEAMLSIGSGAFAMAAPQAFVAQFVEGPVPANIDAMAPWFGSACVLMGYLLWRLLAEGNKESLLAFLHAFLLGDVLFVWVTARFVTRYGQWNAAALGSIGLTVLLAGSRLFYLLLRPESILSKDAERQASPRMA